MEDVSSRRSSNDEYGSFAEMEQVHDVMQLELSHHQLGDSYLDPRSFGDGGNFEEFGGQGDAQRYEVTHSYADQQPAQQQRPSQYHQPPAGSRFDHHLTSSHPPMRAGVPTYPVKTLDPSTCPQYATVRIAPLKPPRIRPSAANRPQKKVPMDPKTVEDEVARNVSQILSATKQQKLAQEAQQRCGIIPPVTRINYSCSDCGKIMTSHRNLQRHRQQCYRKVDDWVDQSWSEQWGEKDRLSEDSNSLPGMGVQQHSSISSESSGWCSPNGAYSPPSTMETIDMGNMLPLSLETDDSQTHSSSASHCSNSSGGKESFMCDSCKKSVCSQRSLKRHQGTCKRYLAEFGPPGEDTDVVVPAVKRQRAFRRVKAQPACYKEDSSEGSASPGETPPRRPPLETEKVAADSTQDDEDRIQTKQQTVSPLNTCTDCNRQLCSASNLKRHRATCKAALTKEDSGSSTPVPPPAYSAPLPELPARDRNIIDRSYAAAIAASEQVKMQAKVAQRPASPSGSLERPRQQQQQQQQQYTAYIVTSPRVAQKPWVTVGEHLRAQQMQKMEQEKEQPSPQGAILIQNTPPPGAPAHNQIVEIRRPSLIKEEEKPPCHRPMESPVYKTNSVVPPPSSTPLASPKEPRPTHMTVVKSDPSEIPPLESIITTQPLSGDRVTGVPVLVHDSRQFTAPNKSSAAREVGEFKCPECQKTYSCRKNVKRHRMAVHKLTSDDINRYPGPTPCPHAVAGDSSQLSPSLPKILNAIRGGEKPEYSKSESLSPNFREKAFSEFQDTAWRNSLEYMEDDDQNGPRIVLETKPPAEMNLEEKKSRTELAEADSTFNEDKEFGRSSHHSSPGVVSSSGPLPSLASWMGSKPLSVDIPYGGARSAGHSPLFKSRRLDYDPSNFFTQNDGTPSDPMLGHGPSSAPRPIEEENWFKREEMPDSTTSQRLDRSTSPCVLMDAELGTPLGSLPYTRKRALSGGNNSSTASPAATFINDPKQARHLCQNCGKFYSSEWNLERHRRESCPTKPNPAEGNSSSTQNDDVSIIIGSCRFILPRTALTKASSAFTSLFLLHDPAKGDLRLEGDPMNFQNLLDVYNDPVNLNRGNVDQVLLLAEQYKFPQVTDTCAKFIENELSKQSVMHAIRLADQFKLLAVKQRLFSSISIQVFRALNSDRDYQMMSAELKAELLEKWGTFL